MTPYGPPAAPDRAGRRAARALLQRIGHAGVRCTNDHGGTRPASNAFGQGDAAAPDGAGSPPDASAASSAQRRRCAGRARRRRCPRPRAGVDLRHSKARRWQCEHEGLRCTGAKITDLIQVVAKGRGPRTSNASSGEPESGTRPAHRASESGSPHRAGVAAIDRTRTVFHHLTRSMSKRDRRSTPPVQLRSCADR